MTVTPVVSVDRRTIANGTTGAITKQLKQHYMQLAQGGNPAYLNFCTPVY